MQDPLGKPEAFVGADSQQILDKPCMERAGIGTSGQDMAHIHEQDGRIFFMESFP